MSIIIHALEEPMRQILTNAGLEPSVIVNDVKMANNKNYGYDAFNNKYYDMVEMGIVDPAKVTRCALQNAASIAEMILTTEVLVADEKEEKPECAAIPQQSPGMMY